jgi:hypothetical protein
MSTTAKQAFLEQVRARKGKGTGGKKYTFNEAEQSILDEGRKTWASGQVKAKQLKVDLYTEIKTLYKAQHGKVMEGWDKDSLRRAVERFVQVRCKQRSRAARVGTRRLTWREVLYYQRQDDVTKMKKKLAAKTGKPAFHCHQKAITMVAKSLTSAEREKLKVTASAWNLTGPPDRYKER